MMITYMLYISGAYASVSMNCHSKPVAEAIDMAARPIRREVIDRAI